MLLTNWRLILLEIPPAIWIGAIVWDWRAHASGQVRLREFHGWALVGIASVVVAANAVAYWCNTVIAFALQDWDDPSIGRAWRRAWRRRRVLWMLIVGVGLLHASVMMSAAGAGRGWYAAAFGVVAVVQMYALGAVPSAVAGLPKRTGSFGDHLGRIVTSGIVVAIAMTPGLLLTRFGMALVDWRLVIVAIPMFVVGTVLQIAGTSSTHAVALATRARPEDDFR